MMTSRIVSAALVLALASAGATALAQSSGAIGSAAMESGTTRLAPRFPAPPSYGADALTNLRGDILTTGSIAQRQRETRAR
ncbi:MAG: hypothetical protein K2Y56_21865 [Methylobacterium sp.]|uniref:hypothetical protein n=1 Tax=Methylobacterium sp. TaxID=409 RepID=UPI0025E1FD79|nr:hypothetical protein [Methylobacterium sp.]MBX9934132.1 hypothetical protein [Methylobacterium sp.]